MATFDLFATVLMLSIMYRQMFWTDVRKANPSIGRAEMTGIQVTGKDTLHSFDHYDGPRGLAIAEDRVYWIEVLSTIRFKVCFVSGSCCNRTVILSLY